MSEVLTGIVEDDMGVARGVTEVGLSVVPSWAPSCDELRDDASEAAGAGAGAGVGLPGVAGASASTGRASLSATGLTILQPSGSIEK